MKNRLFIIIVLCLSLYNVQGQIVYHLSTENTLDLTVRPCTTVGRDAAIGRSAGYLEISDIIGQLLSSETGISEFSIRPYNFKVTPASCRYIEGPNRGKTFTLGGGYTITIDPTLDSYYERENNGALYFEKINTSVLFELNCNTNSINASDVIVDADVVEWEYRFEGNTKVLENSQGKTSLPIDFENFDIDLNANNNKIIDFRYKLNGNVYSRWRTYTIVVCSPKLIEPEGVFEKDASCFGEINGSVTLKFDRNVNVDGGYEMRYFLYEGTRPEDPDDTSLEESNLQSENPVFPDTKKQTVADPFVKLNDSFEGTVENLGEGSYFIVYQEVKYDQDPSDGTDNPIVNSGEITRQFTIGQPTEVLIDQANTTFTPASCGENAIITMSATGGDNLDNTGTYSYKYQINKGDWMDASNPLEITPTADIQTVGIKAVYNNGNACEGGFVDFVIDPVTPSLLIVGTSSVKASTDAAKDGSLRIQLSGGVANFDYLVEKFNSGNGQWESNETKNDVSERTVDFFGKDIGTYRITVTDEKDCFLNSENIEVTSDSVPSLQAKQTNQITCFGGSDGSVSAEVINYSKNYRYQWVINGTASDIQLGTSGTIALNNLSEVGDYVLRVSAGRVSNEEFSNSLNYVATPFVLIAPDSVVIESINGSDTSCNGSDDGSIVLGLSGGTNYEHTFKLNPIESDWIPLNGNSISNLSPGSYRVTVRNENGCESAPSDLIFIDEPDQLVISEVANSRQNVTVNGGNDGGIVIAIEGGTAPFTFGWIGPTFSNDQNPTGLTAGNYNLTVTDANACIQNFGPITITEPGPLGITSLNATDVLCKGDATGSITAEVSGTPPFTFVWTKDGDPGFTAPNQAGIVGLSEGTYNLELTDASGDPAVTAMVFVSEPSEVLGGGITPIGTSCFNGSDGQITINASGGTAPYQFAIDDGFGFQDSNTFTDLSARTYTVTVQDNNGCLFETTVDIGQPDAITIDTANTSITDATTTGGSEGAIDLVVIGGTGAYTYEWSGPNVNGNTSQNLAGLVAGTYQVLVTDANGCALNEEFAVGEPGPLSITNIQVSDVGCNGQSTGSITTTVSGNGNITFEWSDVNTNNIVSTDGKDLDSVPAGTYTLTIADDTANPPVTSQEIEITEPVILSAVIIPSEVSCFGGNDGAIQVNVNGGVIPYSYSIDGVNFQNNNQFNNLKAGTYDVTIRDTNNCDLTTTTVVTQPQELGIIVDQQKNLTAANTVDGVIAITVFGGTAPYSYQWTSDNGFTSSDEDLSDLEGGTYTLVIRDANNIADGDGCYFTRDFTIAEPGELLVSLTQTVFLDCYNDDFAELTANVEGGVAPYAYQWFIVENGSNNLLSENSGIIGNLVAGEYFVRVTDINSISVETSPFTISEPNPIEINLEGKVDVLCNGESTGSIAISVTGGTAPYQYFWDNGAITEDLNGLPAGDYILEVVDVNGCFTERGITIEAPADALRIVNANLTNISAYQADDGSIALDITGGAGSNSISWTRLSDNANMGNTDSLDNLSADTYQVTITDANGCNITESYEITQPDIVEETMIPPTCAGASDGSISILVNKGNGAFTYAWNTGETTRNLNGLPAGTYTVTISGFGDGPITRSYQLEDPLPLVVDLGEDRVLCDGQRLELDATVVDPTATYSWTSDNGFVSSEPSVILSEKGNYTLVVESRTGCTTAGTIFIDVSTEEISAEFAVSSQVFVGESMILVDISYPLPDSVEWILPEEATVVKSDKDEAELVFNIPGEYEIGIITQRGPCTAQQLKKVLVLAKDGTVNEEEVEFNKKIVEDFVIFPNPTNGQFTTQINLTERGNISIRVFSFANNALIASHKARGESSYKISMDISGKPAGVYAIVLETPYGTSLRKIILK